VAMTPRQRFEHAANATGDLVRRAGGVQFQIIQDADSWLAEARFPGDGVISERAATPWDACLALCLEMLDGTLCRSCALPVTIFPSDGNFCVWQIKEGRWQSGCGLPIDENLQLVPKASA